VAHRRAVILMMGSSVSLSVAAIALASHEVRDFFLFLMTRGHETQNLESFGGRLQLWEFGLKIFRDRPYLGTGYGTYPEGLEGGHFHNVFIELLVTTGVVGAASYMAFLLRLSVAIRQSVDRLGLETLSERIIAADLVTIPAVIIAANGATAGAAYYSWDLLGLMSVAVASGALMATGRVRARERVAVAPYGNLLR
jgi:O-antigen ligase